MSITALSASFAEGNIASRLSLQHPSLFYTVVEQSSVAISLTDPQGRICYANPAFCRQTGFALETLLGENHRLLASQQTPKHIYDE
ncbi:PAS domain S-box protein, partial [Rahnella aceris]